MEEFVGRCARHNAMVIFCGLRGQPRTIARQMHLARNSGNVRIVTDFKSAVDLSREIVAEKKSA